MTDDDDRSGAATHDDDRPGGTTDDDRPSLARQREVEAVYQPAEDSRLLAETVIEAAESGAVSLDDGSLALDVGTGSGYVANRLRDATGARVLGSDLSPEACRDAATAGVAVVRANVVDPFHADVFDVVVCNPPYLPTPPEQEWGDWMERALSGGEDGRAVVDPFLDDVGRVLAPSGTAFLLISTLTDPEAVQKRATAAGLEWTVLAEESHPFETLFVYRLRPV